MTWFPYDKLMQPILTMSTHGVLLTCKLKSTSRSGSQRPQSCFMKSHRKRQSLLPSCGPLMCFHTMKKWRIRSHIASDSTLWFTKCLHVLCQVLPRFLGKQEAESRLKIIASPSTEQGELSLQTAWHQATGCSRSKWHEIAARNGHLQAMALSNCNVSYLFCAWKMQLHWEVYAVSREAIRAKLRIWWGHVTLTTLPAPAHGAGVLAQFHPDVAAAPCIEAAWELSLNSKANLRPSFIIFGFP